jgi:hypothetical protein
VGGKNTRVSKDLATSKKAKQKISKKRRFLDLDFLFSPHPIPLPA